jgi:hypothetical protein
MAVRHADSPGFHPIIVTSVPLFVNGKLSVLPDRLLTSHQRTPRGVFQT